MTIKGLQGNKCAHERFICVGQHMIEHTSATALPRCMTCMTFVATSDSQ